MIYHASAAGRKGQVHRGSQAEQRHSFGYRLYAQPLKAGSSLPEHEQIVAAMRNHGCLERRFRGKEYSSEHEAQRCQFGQVLQREVTSCESHSARDDLHSKSVSIGKKRRAFLQYSAQACIPK